MQNSNYVESLGFSELKFRLQILPETTLIAYCLRKETKPCEGVTLIRRNGVMFTTPSVWLPDL